MLMRKYLIIGSLLLLAILLVGCSKDQSTTTIKENEDQTVTINQEKQNEISLNENQNIVDTLVFDENIAIYSIDKIDNKYIAYGSKDNQPFIQSFKVEGNQLAVVNDISLNEAGGFNSVTNEGYYYKAAYDRNESFKFIMTEEKLVPIQIKQIQNNYSKGAVMTPKYFVIHETNNTRAGADANAHYRYWNTNSSANASTHFVVDNNEIYQMLQLNQVAWHVGDNRGHSNITNYNSIGLEIAVNSDGDYQVARQNAIQLTINVMNELNMNISQLKRHYDASGKWCPTNMLDEPELWKDFVAQVEAGLNNKI